MSWLYGQTWLWYLAAFAVGVLLAWLLLVLPQQRRLATLPDRAPEDRGDRDRPVATAAEEPPPVDDAVTERIPATNPALSTLDTFATGPLPVTNNTPGRAATAGLGAAGSGASVDAETPGEVTTEIPPTPDAPEAGSAEK